MFLELYFSLIILCYVIFNKAIQINKYNFLNSLHFKNNIGEKRKKYLIKKNSIRSKITEKSKLRTSQELYYYKYREENAECKCDDEYEEYDNDIVEDYLKEGEEFDEIEEDYYDEYEEYYINENIEKRKIEYKKLFNIDENDEYQVLSPKYNMNIYNILEKKYDKDEEKNKVILTINNLNYEIDNKKLINNLNFQLSKSECVGLIGNNGCGKTSLLNLIYENADKNSKSIIISNRKISQDILNFKLNEKNLLAAINKNDFGVLYKILSYMKNNSLELSAMPSLIKNKDMSYFQMKKNNKINNNELFYKNDVFYFKQNIHLLEDNNLTVFEKVLRFYESTLEKYEVLNYIEENISQYRKYEVINKFNIKEDQAFKQTPEDESDNKKSSRNNNINYNETKLNKFDDIINNKNKNIIDHVSNDSNKEYLNDVNSNYKTKLSTDKANENFVKSKYFEMILKLYMYEKEYIFKEINDVKMNFNKYVNILNLKNFLYVKLCHLSNGYIIRVYLLLLLLSKSKLLLIDEINNNLDIFNIFFIMNIFNYSLKYKKMGIILASHDFFLVSKLCNRILDFNKICGYDIDFNNVALLKKIIKNDNKNIDELKNNEKICNLTYFQGNYTQYLNNMKVLFDNRKKKKEELKKILDQLNSTISKSKKKNKKEFMQQFLKKKEEELKLYQNIYSIYFDSKLNYQYMYYNLVYSNKNKNSSKSYEQQLNRNLDNKEKINVNYEKQNFKQNSDLNINENIVDIDDRFENIKKENYNKYTNPERVSENIKNDHVGYSIGNDNSVSSHENQSIYSEENGDEEDIKTFVYNKLNDIESNMNKNILIDMSKKIKNNELIQTGEVYSTGNATLYEFNNFTFYFLNKKNKKKKYIFKEMNLSINSGENILILGKNGIGKSTFFKILTNKYNLILKEKEKKKKSIYAYGDNDSEESNDNAGCEKNRKFNCEGAINCNFNNVLLTYFEQNMIKSLNLEINDHFKNLIENVSYYPISFNDNFEMNPFNENLFFYVLNKTKLFENDKIDNIEEKINALLKIFYIDSATSIKEKSGGEKVRILFLSLFLKKSNLLLLDEINNNLDIYLKNLLLNFLNFIYEGNYILTTHDFYIIKNLQNIHKIIYIFDYQNIFTFYNVKDFIDSFYNFILNSFNVFKRDGELHKKSNIAQILKDNDNSSNLSYYKQESTLNSCFNKDNEINIFRINNSECENITKKEEELNKKNYEKYLYDKYDYEILDFLKGQVLKEKNERKNYEQINVQENKEKKKVKKKNFGGKGSSGKIKIKNWKRWKK
ncbi:ABC transporter F family member 1, putative [Plasmodium relictum]|uniref:ABC transporter F family member 1, putative n=1 Tax=Plasmodium relictum TaxID=85471 RepID=A0A1J1HAT3_PLARL|nr:ABC transporter F family member 1, putative [Plasmodium relictum]CRH02507.1 ABC transporter F family member 1, putative [Plasmodium relictum]